MAAESNVGARLFIIGKDGVLSGLNEITAATARLNAEIARGAAASKTQAAGMTESEAAMARYSAVLKEQQTQLDAVASVGKYAFWGIAAAAAVAGYESIKWAQTYQTQLTRLRTQAGLTVGAMNAIGAAAKANAASLGTNPTAYVQAAYHPASTGMSVAQTIAITNNAARLAAIGGAPLEDTTNALTGVMKSYNTPASQTQRTAAILNAIVGAGNMHYGDLNAALSSGVASTGKLFGVDLKSIGGALAYMTDRGVPAAQAGTHLRMALSLLGAPSGEATKLLTAAGLGSSAAQDASSAMAQTLRAAGVSTTQLSAALRNNSGGGGIYNALDLLKTDLTRGGVSPAMQAAMISRSFGGGRMGSTIQMMYNNIGGLGQKTQQIDKNGNPAQLTKDWAATTQTLEFQWKRFTGTMQTFGTTMGTAVLPVLTTGLKLLSDTASFLDHNKAVAIGLATALTAIVAPAIGVYLYRALLSSGGAIRTVIAGYGQLIGMSPSVVAANDEVAASENTVAAAADRVATANGIGRGGVGGAAGIGGKAVGAAAGILGAYMVGGAIRGNSGTAVNNSSSNSAKIRSFLGDVGEGALAGATIGSIIPGVGTVIGGAAGAAVGGVVAERHQIGAALTHGWDDLFGGGGSHGTPRTITVQNHVVVEIDGKQVAAAVKKNTRASAARS